MTPQLLNPMHTGSQASSLRAALTRKVIGQDEAVRHIVESLQIFAAGLQTPGRPVGSFLFIGPTGSGKTRLVEAVAEEVLGSANAVIKIDCGEFQHSHEIAKLVGAPPGYMGHRETYPLLSQDALNRFHTPNLKLSFLLFDEIEKATDALWNLLLGILDKATLTLGNNRRVDFSQSMIFMTGNVGASEISREVTHRIGLAPASTRPDRAEQIAVESARRRFSPEFFNRIDKIVIFQALGEAELRRILDLELSTLSERFALRIRFVLSVTQPAKDYLLMEGTDIRYGARHLKRAIERSLVVPVSNLMATGQVRVGDVIRLDFDRERQQLVFFKDAENAAVPESPQVAAAEVRQTVAATAGMDPQTMFPAVWPYFCD
jgi:ATP-dependent Clp protease ATP-binding subunit ClpA